MNKQNTNVQHYSLLVRLETIVFGRTYFFSTRDLRDVSADRREILHGGQY